MRFDVIIAIASIVAGAVAAVAGFGIGSILTPLMALRADTKAAVAAVSVPHLIGTFLRFWRLRRHVDRGVFWAFGVTSAVGGLIGALLHNLANSPVLSAIFGALLVFAGISGLTWVVRKDAPWPEGSLRRGCRFGSTGRPGGKPGRDSFGRHVGIRYPEGIFRRHRYGDRADGGCRAHARLLRERQNGSRRIVGGCSYRLRRRGRGNSRRRKNPEALARAAIWPARFAIDP